MALADTLSQSEIDALLVALTSGEVSAEEMRKTGKSSRVRTYDFRRAMRFSKDHIRIISRIHEYFGRLMTTQLSGNLRTVVQFQLESVDQVPYEEFIRSIPPLTVIELMDFNPLQGKVAVEINPQVVFAILDRFMGGSIQGPYRERELTEIEHKLLSRILGNMGSFFAEAWSGVTDLQPRFLSIESNPQFLQLATPNETVLVVTMSAKVGSVTGLLNICLPHVTVEPILPLLSSQNFLDGSRAKTHGIEEGLLEEHMKNMPVDFSVQLTGTELTVSELLDLQVGDVIPLRNSIRDPFMVTIQGVPAYQGSMGRLRDKAAVKILDVWKGDIGDVRRRQTLARRD